MIMSSTLSLAAVVLIKAGQFTGLVIISETIHPTLNIQLYDKNASQSSESSPTL